MPRQSLSNYKLVETYQKKNHLLNEGLCFNLNTWFGDFSEKANKKSLLDFLNPFSFQSPSEITDFVDYGVGFIGDFNITTFAKSGVNVSGFLTHKPGSESHDAGRAVDISSANFPALYYFFKYLLDLQKRGAKFRLHISTVNHHIHVDNRPDHYGDCKIEVDNNSVKDYDELDDDKVRQHYGVPLLPKKEEGSSFTDSFLVWGLIGFLALLLLLLGVKK